MHQKLLDHDHAVVHEQSGHQGHTCQRDQIQRQAQRPEQQQRHGHGYPHAEQHGHTGPYALQQRQQHQHEQRKPQSAPQHQIPELAAHILAAIQHHQQPYAFGQFGPQPLDGCVHGLGHRQQVATRLSVDRQRHHRLAVDAADRTGRRWSQSDAGHIAQADRRGVGSGLMQDQVADCVQIGLGRGEQQPGVATGLPAAVAPVAQCVDQLLLHAGRGQAVGFQPIRIQCDEQFPLAPAGHPHKGHAGYAPQAWGHQFVGQPPQHFGFEGPHKLQRQKALLLTQLLGYGPRELGHHPVGQHVSQPGQFFAHLGHVGSQRYVRRHL